MWLEYNEEPSAYAAGLHALACDALGVGRLHISLYSNHREKRAWAWRCSGHYTDRQGRRYHPGQRLVVYEPKFMTQMDRQTRTPWFSIKVLAHEIGHHLAWERNPEWTRESWDCEQAANYYAGWALANLGAGLHDLERASPARHLHNNATRTHPSGFHLFRAVKQGWLDADGEDNGYENQPNILNPSKRWYFCEEPPIPPALQAYTDDR